MGKTMVSIFCLTYNHAPFIKDALEGFLKQKTSFAYNVLVFDDASTDGTSDILMNYQKKYPEIFNVYISPQNTYNSPEREKILSLLYDHYLTGKYIAWCEGDDYWIDENKLQLQVDYMEHNLNCSMTAHAARWLDCTQNKEWIYSPYDISKKVSPEEIILQKNGNLSTATLVMHREVFFRENSFPRCDVEDWPIQLYAICKGEIYYFNKVMSVYRYMHPGSWSAKISKDEEKHILHNYGMVDFLKKYDIFTKLQFHDVVRKRELDYLYCNVLNNISMDVTKYLGICSYLNKITEDKYNEYIKSQLKIFEIIKGTYIFDRNEREIILRYKYIVIMGNGEFAGYLNRILLENNVVCAGHIVSSNNNGKNENVWEVGNYPYDPMDTLIIVGIHQKEEQEICKTLEINGFINIITPLWFNV